MDYIPNSGKVSYSNLTDPFAVIVYFFLFPSLNYFREDGASEAENNIMIIHSVGMPEIQMRNKTLLVT